MRSKFLLMGAILAGVAMASPARADFQLEYSVNGGPFHTVSGSGSGSVDDPYSAVALVGSLTIIATGSGTTTPMSSSLDLTVGGSEAKNTTIQVYVSMTGVLTTPPPQTLSSSMGAGLLTGSGLNNGKAGAVITESDYLAQSNNLFDIGPPGDGIVVVGPQTIASGKSVNNTVLVSLSSPYSWTLGEKLDNSANGYSTNNMSNDNNATLTSAPAPAGLVLLASAAPLLAGTWWRHRKARPPS